MRIDSINASSEIANYKKEKIKYILLLCFGVFFILIGMILTISIGNYHTTLRETFNAIINPDENEQIFNIIIYSRMPRMLGSLLVGAALSVSGYCYQSIFKNKMASPDLLGVSAGSSVGAVIAILSGLSYAFISVFSFVGGIISVVITVTISSLFKNDNKSVSLLLSGIVISGLMNSFVGLAKFIADDSVLVSITYWLLGGFTNVRYEQLCIAGPIIVLCVILLVLLRWKITILQNNDADAISHGINVKRTRFIIIVFATIATAISVSISGTIGWVGLAIPNLINLIVKNDSKKAFVLSAIYGSLFTMICDLLSRTLSNSEIPVGIITGFFGAIIFIVVLVFRRLKNGH